MKKKIKKKFWINLDDHFSYTHHNYIEHKYTYKYEKLLDRLGLWISKDINKQVGLLRSDEGNLFESISIKPELKLTIIVKPKFLPHRERK